YEIEDLQEAIQLIPQIGQSLVIAAHPRKTAMLLQASRAHIKKLQTKVLLISPKPIPRRTVDKFMKVGLTECIVEPIVPKTLQYKVNLLIRSIVIKKEEGSFEKKFDADEAVEHSDIEVKEVAKKARDQQNNEVYEDDESQEEEGFYQKNKEKSQDNVIEGYYKGKMKKGEQDNSPDEDSDEEHHNDDHIEAYYKGNINGKGLDIENDEDEEDELDISDDDEEIKKLAGKVNLILSDEDDALERSE